MEVADKLPYEFEIPPSLWRLLKNVDPNTPSNAKFYATLTRDGDILVKGYRGFHVPRGNPFSLAFYKYLREQRNLPPELEQIQTHPIIKNIIEEARRSLSLRMVNETRHTGGFSEGSGSHKGGGGGH